MGNFKPDEHAPLSEPPQVHESAQSQLNRLAVFIQENVPEELSESEGAVDVAIRLLWQLDEKKSEAGLAPVPDDRYRHEALALAAAASADKGQAAVVAMAQAFHDFLTGKSETISESASLRIQARALADEAERLDRIAGGFERDLVGSVTAQIRKQAASLARTAKDLT